MTTEITPVTGADLKEWGHRPGKHFPALLDRANAMRAEGFGLVRIRQELEGAIAPEPPRLDLRAPGEVAFHENIIAEGADEEANLASVRASMAELMRTPTIEAGAIMPDACPGRRARSRWAAWLRQGTRSIPACIRPISAVR